jgi:hypothetical protein
VPSGFGTILAVDLLCILKSIVAWAVLTFVGTNLIGFVVRGIFWSPPHVEATDERMAQLFRHETRRACVGNAAITLLSILATAAYLFALFHFWNVWLAVAALLVMASRLPDLMWEIRTDKRVTRQNAPKGWLYVVTTVVWWGMLPLIWYALCKMP